MKLTHLAAIVCLLATTYTWGCSSKQAGADATAAQQAAQTAAQTAADKQAAADKAQADAAKVLQNKAAVDTALAALGPNPTTAQVAAAITPLLDSVTAAKFAAALAANPTAPVAAVSTVSAGLLAQGQALTDQFAQAVADAKTARDAATKATAAQTAANDAYTKAQAKDDQFWGSAQGIITIVGSAFGVGGLGGLVGLIRGKTVGQGQGAAMATTAITNADTSDVLQQKAAKDAVDRHLALAPDSVKAAVAANL